MKAKNILFSLSFILLFYPVKKKLIYGKVVMQLLPY